MKRPATEESPITVVETPQARCRVGLARADITPPVGIYHRMWGAAVHDRALAVHRPLQGTVLWLEPLESVEPCRHILVAIDHCVLEGAEQLKLRQAIADATQTPVEEISFSLSHTHGSGWMSRSRAELPGGELIGPYLDRLATQLAELAVSAARTLAPATIAFGRGRSSLAAHRDYWDEGSGRFVCGFNPAGAADDTLLIGRITDDAGSIRAVLVNYACHPTTLAWDNRAISPDWVGAMRETIEDATGGICLFLQGASGDLGPREGFVGDTVVADRNGRQVGYAALAALEALPPANTRYVYGGPVVSGTWIGTWRHESVDELSRQRQAAWRWEHHVVELAYRPDLPTIEHTERQRAEFESQERAAQATGEAERARDCRAKVEQMTRQLARLRTLPPGKTFPLRVTIGQLGDALWVLVPGELYQVFQTTLRERFAPRPVIIATLTNDWHPGYIPAEASYGRGIYQDVIAAVAPGSLELLVETVTHHLRQLVTHS
jgi:hypothetical protein